MPPPMITKQQALAALAAAAQARQDQGRHSLAAPSMDAPAPARRASHTPPPLPRGARAAAAGVPRATLYRLFGSQQTLLQELGLTPPPMVRSRILDTAVDLVGRQGLAEMSMAELAC